MKILHLIESAATGAGRHVADLTQGLLDRGHHVDLVYSASRCDGVFRADVRRLARCPNFRAFQIPMQRRPGPSDLRAIRNLRGYIRAREPFDLIHCHSTKAGLLGRLGLVGFAGKRIYTPHMFFTMNPEVSPVMKRVIALMEAPMSTLGDGVIAVSPQERTHALKIGVKASKVVVIPNGVSLDKPALSRAEIATLRRTWGVGEGDVCIGFVGRMSLQKSPETMLRAFAASPLETRTTSRLIMVGDGPLDGSLRKLAADLGIAQRIVWLGARDARPLMPAFDILALTSDSEGHPLVVLEAMACGLPIVATAVGGVPETVQHGVNGFITPVRGVDEIAAALETLVRNPEMRKRMGEASRVIVQDFSIDRMVDRTIAFYEEVLSGSLAKDDASDLRVNSRSLKASAE